MTSGRPVVALIGAYDTKAEPLGHLFTELVGEGCAVHRIDFGTHSQSGGTETSREDLSALVKATELGEDRAGHLEMIGEAVGRHLQQLHADGELDAILLAGGSGAATVFAAAAPSLPFGVPKVLVSTVVAGDTRPYLQGLDALLFYPVVDVEGTNTILRSVLSRAATATAALAHRSHRPGGTESSHAGSIATTMFGITTQCVAAARSILEQRDHEVITFHANGTGGAAMERLVRDGMCRAVLDVTTTELADHVAGGALSAGESRLTAAAEMGIPQVVVPGAMDTVNFGPPASVPAAHRDRLLHAHNPHVTLMRTDAEECAELGALLARRSGVSPDTTTVVVPRGGFSELDQPGRAFWDPEADDALVDALRGGLEDRVRLVESPLHINDPGFAALLVDELSRLCGQS
ncbi:Tm-1-like ATP-binding domain-containing protein [Aeromicrobium sp. CTD01-1L150]|uniref:Tm-1-like ATP-binding domain-containing protein n=1 Tax=Aeromicrobium sp. CTD01-1L150 TaxID=3341830 RepID=UPI0035BFDF9D